ncbi:hypothetical protein [Paraburkholderia tagetis]|uniref:Lipoprotein n=1 Tax=Paraburkholderia tagetis TaxID=2913261 RepID=A0A9X1RQX1_9BURK|nr:hypothetical protein [Paraburkholderia tagetis]MCG5075155.1 hypothetical protein [Paraburkholderia tagetis]
MVVFKKQHLLVLSGILLVACTPVQPDSAQAARPSETSGAQPGSPLASSAPAANPAAGQTMLYYVCGKPGIDGHEKSPAQGHPFNMGVSFVSASNGAPLSNVAVKVKRHGRVLMDFVAQGPQCLFSVPEADYRIEGTWRGEMKFEVVQTGTMNAQIKW